MASSSSSSACRLHPQWKYLYDVFVTFYGEDIGNSFLSHLFAAFLRESVNAFSDEQLTKGSENMPALLKAIEGSKISVIIFSKRYAFSKRCMDELVRIMECQKEYQIVIPVFYKVLPCDVRSQDKSFGQAFVEHQRNLMPGLQKWKAVLAEASNLAGWDSKVTRPEATLVQAIVNDIVKKLESIADSMVKELESLFGSLYDRLDSPASSFLNNIELKNLYYKVKEVHVYLLENAERYRSYPYWSLCHLFTDLRDLAYDVHVLIDDKAYSGGQFNQAVKKFDQWLLRFLDSVNNLVACHNIRERTPIFQQPVPRTVTYACVEDIADNTPSFNISISKSRFKEAIFKLEIHDDQARKKAFNIISKFRGINSITFGLEDNKITVTGCNLDALSIGTKLKKLCHTELVFLGSAKMPEDMGEEPKANTNEVITDQLVKTKKASKLLTSILSRMCISFK